MKSLLGLNIFLTLCVLVLSWNHSRQIEIFDNNGEIVRKVILRNSERLRAIEQYMRDLSASKPSPTPTPSRP